MYILFCIYNPFLYCSHKKGPAEMEKCRSLWIHKRVVREWDVLPTTI